jgi:Gpi18-like mannosyltransferase
MTTYSHSAPTPVTPWRRIVLRAAGVWLATRACLALFTYFAVLFHAAQINQSAVLSPHLLLASWLHWDAGWYTGIVRTGYAFPRQTVFFPLYVLLTQLVVLILGPAHILLSAMLVSNLATLAAFIGLAALAVHEGATERAATTTLLVFAAYPLAFFLAAAYTEGLFVACAVWALYAARRGWWYRAGLFALLTGLTRSTAIILILPLAYEFARQHGWLMALRERRPRTVRDLTAILSNRAAWRRALDQAPRFLAASGGPCLGIAIWAAVCALRFGDPLAFINQEAYWHHVTMPPWQTIGSGVEQLLAMRMWSYSQARYLIDFLPVLLVLLLSLLAVRHMPVTLTLYSLCLAVLTLSTPVAYVPGVAVYNSFGRYMIPALPVFLLLGRLADRRPALQTLLLCGGFMLQAIFATFFLTGGWLI